jgi:broad specificity phosphatase PhoE
MKRISIALVLLAALLTAHPLSAEQVIFVVRHAERAAVPASQTPPSGGMMADDPPLSPAGEERAARLASLLASAGIRQIFTSEYRRTRQTAAPLAGKLGITPVTVPAKEPDALVEQVRRATGNVLVVGHSNTVPDLLTRLGVAEKVTIGDNDYDNVFLVIRSSTGASTLVTLKY